jgi:peroxiredoxin
LKRLGSELPLISDRDNHIRSSFGVQNYPTGVIINKLGKIVNYFSPKSAADITEVLEDNTTGPSVPRKNHWIGGPELGENGVSISVTSINGSTLELGVVHRQPRLLFFAMGGCSFCDTARPILNRLANANGDRVQVVVVYQGDEEKTRMYTDDMPANVAAVADQKRELARFWKVKRTPFVIVMDPQGVVRAKGIGSKEEALLSFFELAVNPPSL